MPNEQHTAVERGPRTAPSTGRAARRRRRRAGRAVVVAVAATAALLPAGTRAGQTGDAVTISLSGSTAMSNFTRSVGITQLTSGTSITLNSGPGGTPVTYSAASGSFVQLAPGDFAAAETATSVRGFRIEWHEQGSVEGILELVDSQINDGFLGNTIYNPTSGLGTFVNRNKFGGTGTTTAINPPDSAAASGYTLSLYNDPNTRVSTGGQAQSRVQMAISDVNHTQGFSIAGTAGFRRAPGAAGYGLGNPVLSPAALGVASARQSLQDSAVLNFSTTRVDPATGANYVAGNPGEAGGVNNLRSVPVAITATLFVANPGTGLERINRTDAQWLQAAGRLSNGADFNVTTRDVNSGTRNVAATNAGLDPSFAGGEYDAGNGNGAGGGTTQVNVGPGITFSNKTSGGSQLRPVVQNARMGFGHLSMSDSIGSTNNGAGRPIRALLYRDDANDAADGSNAALSAGFADPASGTFVQPSAQTIVNGQYVVWQNETYVTVRRPDGTYANNDPATEAIKGDNAGNDVRDFRQNILGSVATFPAPTLQNPADALVATSFILPQFMEVRKDRDGLNQSVANAGYNATLSGQFLGEPTLTGAFNPAAPGTVTKGNASTYGNLSPAQGAIAVTDENYLFGDFNRAGANKGVRDFSDVAVAQQAQAALQAVGTDMLAGANGSNGLAVAGLPAALTGGFAGTVTKGDLIVMGDFNADGKFNGEDLRRMARGTALADSTAATTLSGGPAAFADKVRTGVLRKNAALDQLQAATAAGAQGTQQRVDAAAPVIVTLPGVAPAGTEGAGANQYTVVSRTGAAGQEVTVYTFNSAASNAFNKFDVNRDGRVTREDAQLVDHFVGKDYRNLDDQLGAVAKVRDDGVSVSFSTATGQPLDPAAPANANVRRVQISLVDIELNDDGPITSVGSTSDFGLIRGALTDTSLLGGDANFDGTVGVSDLGILATNFNLASGGKWSLGDFNQDGAVGVSDLGILATNFNGTAAQFGLALSQYPELGGDPVPEPTAAAATALAAVGLLARRRRRLDRRPA